MTATVSSAKPELRSPICARDVSVSWNLKTGSGSNVSLSLDAILSGREIVSTMNGGARPEEDYPQLIELARSKKIDIAAQITRVWSLAEVEDAIRALRAGEVTRAVLDHRA